MLCRRRGVRKPWKSMFSITPLSFTPRLQGTLANIRINLLLSETTVIALHLCCWQYGSIFIGLRKTCILKQSAKWTFKVIQGHWFRYKSKARIGICNFLLVINSNLGPILPRFRAIAGFLLRTATPPLFHPNFSVVPLGLDCRCCGSEERNP